MTATARPFGPSRPGARPTTIVSTGCRPPRATSISESISSAEVQRLAMALLIASGLWLNRNTRSPLLKRRRSSLRRRRLCWPQRKDEEADEDNT
nr:unnamed protein product [Digitaria exilis]